ncbi:MAG TPA: TIGR03089 family protein, partial [Actinomycetes bacterium]|nr:TIGR03089 family protein [Actinomycetes bacterium]
LEPVPAGVLDYAVEVPGYGDRFAPLRPVVPDDPALEIDRRIWTGAELVVAANAAGDGLTSTDRILTGADPGTWAGLRTALLGPLAAGASVVLCRNLDPARIEARTTMEQITRTA